MKLTSVDVSLSPHCGEKTFDFKISDGFSLNHDIFKGLEGFPISISTARFYKT